MIIVRFSNLMFHRSKTGIIAINLMSVIEDRFGIKRGVDYHVHQTQNIDTDWVDVVIDRKLMMWLMLKIDGLHQFVSVENFLDNERELKEDRIRQIIKSHQNHISFYSRSNTVISNLKIQDGIEDSQDDGLTLFDHHGIGAFFPRW